MCYILSGKDERKKSEWVVRRCACGQKYWVNSYSNQMVCHTCRGRQQREERREEVRNRYPYLHIPHRISPIDREMLERGSEDVILKYKRLWSQRTETGSMDVLLIDAANRVFKYIHVSPMGIVDFDETVEPMIQIVPTIAPGEVGDRITSPEEAADLIRHRRIDRLVNNNGI